MKLFYGMVDEYRSVIRAESLEDCVRVAKELYPEHPHIRDAIKPEDFREIPVEGPAEVVESYWLEN